MMWKAAKGCRRMMAGCGHAGKSEIIFKHITHDNTVTVIFPTLGKLAIPGFRLSVCPNHLAALAATGQLQND